MLWVGQVFADTCSVSTCTQQSSGIFAVLTDGSQGCLNDAQPALVTAYGLSYHGAECNINCNSIYSWSSPAYWNAMGCNLLGYPCGLQGQSPASVADVCQNASLSSMSASGTSRPPSSTSIFATGVSSSSSPLRVHQGDIGTIVGPIMGAMAIAIEAAAFFLAYREEAKDSLEADFGRRHHMVASCHQCRLPIPL